MQPTPLIRFAVAAAVVAVAAGCSSTDQTAEAPTPADHSSSIAWSQNDDANTPVPLNNDRDGKFTFWHWPAQRVYMNSQTGMFYWRDGSQVRSDFEPPAFADGDLGTAVVVRRNDGNPFAGQSDVGVAAVETD